MERAFCARRAWGATSRRRRAGTTFCAQATSGRRGCRGVATRRIRYSKPGSSTSGIGSGDAGATAPTTIRVHGGTARAKVRDPPPSAAGMDGGRRLCGSSGPDRSRGLHTADGMRPQPGTALGERIGQPNERQTRSACIARDRRPAASSAPQRPANAHRASAARHDLRHQGEIHDRGQDWEDDADSTLDVIDTRRQRPARCPRTRGTLRTTGRHARLPQPRPPPTCSSRWAPPISSPASGSTCTTPTDLLGQTPETSARQRQPIHVSRHRGARTSRPAQRAPRVPAAPAGRLTRRRIARGRSAAPQATSWSATRRRG